MKRVPQGLKMIILVTCGGFVAGAADTDRQIESAGPFGSGIRIRETCSAAGLLQLSFQRNNLALVFQRSAGFLAGWHGRKGGAQPFEFFGVGQHTTAARGPTNCGALRKKCRAATCLRGITRLSTAIRA